MTGLRERIAELKILEAERKQAEEALRESEEKYRELYETAPVMLYTLDKNAVLLDCNRALLEACGRSREEMIGKPIYDFQAEESRKLAPAALEEVAREGVSQGERNIITKDGKVVTIGFHAHIEYDEKRNETVIKSAAKDITERKQAEEALRESEKKYRSLFENMLSGFAYCKILVDENNQPVDFVYLDINDAFERLTGLRKEDVVGKKVTEAIPGIKEAHPELFSIYGKVAFTGEPTQFDIYFEPLEIWLTISVYSPQKGYFVAVFDNITERKQAEEALRIERGKLVNIFNSMEDPVYISNLEYDIEYANPVLLRTFGPIENRKCYQYFRNLKEACPNCKKNIVFSGKTFHDEVTIRKNQKTYDILATPVRNTDGSISKLEIFRDITERKQAEEALRESEEKYRGLVTNVKLGVFRSTPEPLGKFLEVNPAMVEITGYSRKKLLQMNVTDLYVYPEERRLVLEEVALGKSRRAKEVRLRKKDGTEIVVLYRKVAVRDDAGRILYFDGIMEDITERKRAEEEIRGLAKFPSENPNPVMRVAQNGTVLYANQATLPLLNEWRCQVGQLLPDYLSQSILEVLDSGSPKYIEVECGEQTFSFMFSPIVDAGYVNLYGRDVTERKQAEEREKELQRELNLSSRLASIGELAAGVAHEINNPLTGILAFSQRLLRKSTDEKVSQGLEIIHNEARRMAKVVENLLTFARHREPKREYLDINDILQKALELRTYELKTGNIEVVTDLAPSLPRTKVDFPQIQEVFLNIILNAEQAMSEANHGGKLVSRTQKLKDNIRISFTDDGPGIPAEHLDKIFDPFFTTRGRRGGTGLGLSVGHGIVTEHGGRIYARSKPGKGATFFVELPLTSGKVKEAKRS